MTKRIFRSICVVSLVVLLVVAVLMVGALYTYFTDVQKTQMRAQVRLVAQAIELEGEIYFEGLADDEAFPPVDYRVTWISSDGTVLRDTALDASGMDNHLDREEIREAINAGFGESVRYSDTLTERRIYAATCLSDGSVVRVSGTMTSLFTLLMSILPQIILTLGVALVLAFLLALYESRRLVKPLNELDLDHPMAASSAQYEELAPLLRRIASQQSQLRNHDAELRQRQDEFRAVTDGLSDGLILFNEQGTVLSINRAAARLMPPSPPLSKHSSRPWAEGRSVSELTPAMGLESLLSAARVKGSAESSVKLNNLSYRLHADPVVSDGRVVGFVILIVNVTEQVQNEQMRREFTANVSHELKTPLHSIAGCSELLAGGLVASEDVPLFAGQIYAEARRMIGLVEDIIRLSHLDEGMEDVEMTTVDLAAVVSLAVDNLRTQAEAADVTLTCEGDDDLWMQGIPQQLGGIVTNLCSNAIKYNRPGGHVTVTATRQSASVPDESDCLVLTVSDTGIGISEEHHERIFERFYRVDKGRSKEVGGTGLGLSIVKHAVRLHGGTIDLDSYVGEGTTVTVRFPAAAEE